MTDTQRSSLAGGPGAAAEEIVQPATPTPPAPTRKHSIRQLLHPHVNRSQLVAAGLCGLLGFAAMIQVRVPEDELLQQARRSDLVQILDGLTQRSDRLEQEIADLETTRRELLSSADRQETALEQSTSRAQTLAVLAGTAPATGSGIIVSISDPQGEITSAVLLSAVQELRDAGAEAIQIEGDGDVAVRVVASTYFLDLPRGVTVDGIRVEPPYRIFAIGDPAMDRALAIPGGVVEEVASKGGRAVVEQVDKVVIDSLHQVNEPEYARPVRPDGSD